MLHQLMLHQMLMQVLSEEGEPSEKGDSPGGKARGEGGDWEML